MHATALASPRQSEETPSTPLLISSRSYSNQTGVEEFEWHLAMKYRSCPRLRRERLDLITGALVPDTCRANGCPYCLPRKVALLARALAAAEPTHLLTVTDTGFTWSETRDSMKGLLRNLRRQEKKIEVAWIVESSAHGTHVHGLVRGELPDVAELTRQSRRAGAGGVDVRPLTNVRGAASYVLKEADPRGYLDRNGGRIVHTSRAYWQADGQSIATQAEAMRAARNL